MGNTTSHSNEEIQRVNHGWIPDPPDDRDYKYQQMDSHKRSSTPNFKSPIPEDHIELPYAVDMRSQCPPILDQGDLSSCTANAIASAYQFLEYQQLSQPNNQQNTQSNTQQQFIPSRLFIYYNERKIEGRIPSDDGATIRSGVKSLKTVGVCNEYLWPYHIEKFQQEPTQLCFDRAKEHQSVEYYSLDNNLEQLKHCLAEGYPFIFGVTLYQSFRSNEVKRTGYTPMPLSHDPVYGNHAMLAVGYTPDYFIVQNSWGSKWGDHGYAYLPYAYLTKYGQSFWTLRKI